ncbi:hypothetical protein LTR70_006670 [Exophiala xenobiotica]|uniref:Uncharacterized protein n=1 Tax=Lithohypha guttulata TaxID=1690604 RepID=A0ABR0K725_9EURO|nr:hypothetical protein LTR24_006251 [Lithohypha guttulata]KAK5315586.1 hypothetical protein LTR70_006670 [Exophiala xenobiotica]
MKFTAILAATLPVLAAASALPGPPQGEGDKPSGMGQWSGAEGQHQGHGAGQGPSSGGEGHATAGDGASAHGEHQHRDLETRANGDYHIEECTDQTKKTCKLQAVVSKGATQGLCVPALYPNQHDATVHIINPQIMCTFHEKWDCSGEERGPWTNNDPEYWMETFQGDFYRWHPAAYKCKLMTFNDVRAPPTRVREEEK